jgi:hypothetical protein
MPMSAYRRVSATSLAPAADRSCGHPVPSPRASISDGPAPSGSNRCRTGVDDGRSYHRPPFSATGPRGADSGGAQDDESAPRPAGSCRPRRPGAATLPEVSRSRRPVTARRSGSGLRPDRASGDGSRCSGLRRRTLPAVARPTGLQVDRPTAPRTHECAGQRPANGVRRVACRTSSSPGGRAGPAPADGLLVYCKEFRVEG